MIESLKLIAYRAELPGWSLTLTDEGDPSLYVPLEPGFGAGITISPEPFAPGLFQTTRQDHYGLIVANRFRLDVDEVVAEVARSAT